MITDHTKRTAAPAASRSGGTVDMRVAVDQNGNLQAFVQKVSGNVTAQIVASNNRRHADEHYLPGGR